MTLAARTEAPTWAWDEMQAMGVLVDRESFIAEGLAALQRTPS
jgi:hypothetical protein